MKTHELVKNKIKYLLEGSRYITPRDINDLTNEALNRLEEGKANDWQKATYSVVEELY